MTRGDDHQIEVVNPATEELVGTVPSGEAADVELAVATAKRAFPGWAATDAEQRAYILSAAAALIEERGKEIAAILTAERGKPIAGPRLKRVSLELGGSDPVIVCEDADVEAAVKAVIIGRYWNAGQACLGCKRVFVHDSVYDDFVSQLVVRVKRYEAGDGTVKAEKPRLRMGPIHTRAGRDELVEQLADGVAKGGELLTGTRLLDNPPANSYDLQVMTEFAAAVDEAIGSGVRAVVVRSASERFFSAGADVKLPLEQGLALEAELIERLFRSRDATEGITAFVEKRHPEFVGA